MPTYSGAESLPEELLGSPLPSLGLHEPVLLRACETLGLADGKWVGLPIDRSEVHGTEPVGLFVDNLYGLFWSKFNFKCGLNSVAKAS